MNCYFNIIMVTVGLLVASLPAQAQALNPDGTGNITFRPGLRIQPHYTFDNANSREDFFIARTRLKGAGEVFDVARYFAEVKLDNVGRLGKEVNVQVENAWLDFAVNPDLGIRAGLYDAPFSRNALTSDSKLLFMDRSQIKDALTALGLADNTIGVLLYGRPWGGRFEYSAGIFDDLQFKQSTTPTAKRAEGAMSTGRLVFNLLDPAKPGGYADYQSSYIGRGQRLSIGANGALLRKAHEGVDDFDLTAMGADLFFNSGAFTFEAEYDRFTENNKGQNPSKTGEGWYIQGGYLFHRSLELALRHQELDPDKSVSGNRSRWISVGLNIYLHEHNLKIQTDYTFKREQEIQIKNDVFQVQLQVDF